MMLQPGSRPVPDSPDYVLVRKLGAGAFGEVWQARGPGGLEVALKFIPLNANVFAAESRSLAVMKSIRHPNLVSLFGAWHKDNWLILAMELCDRSLQDRLAEAIGQGLPGIPLSELLGYMDDAATGLDALNAKQVQHRDVKPANLLLLASGVKVADFGLAKALEQTVASNSGAGTIAYVAPECFKGQLTQQSDQYSLAVAYYHLRTGHLLFKGDQAQVMYGHLELLPDISHLPPAEGAVLGRALSKEPAKRWSSCKALVNELIRAKAQVEEQRRLDQAWLQSLLKKKEHHEVIQLLSEAIRLDRKNARTHYNRGFAWLEKSENDKAIYDFDEAIKLDPSDARYFHERGVAWSNKNVHDKGLADFSAAIRLDPEFAAPYYGRGLAWLTKGEADKAIKDFDAAIRLNPQFADAYISFGRAWLDKKDYDKAIENLDEGIWLDPKNAYAHFYRGVVFWNKKDYDKATLDFDKSVRLDPELWEDAWFYLEWLFFQCSEETRRRCEGGGPLRWWRLLHEETEED